MLRNVTVTVPVSRIQVIRKPGMALLEYLKWCIAVKGMNRFFWLVEPMERSRR